MPVGNPNGCATTNFNVAVGTGAVNWSNIVVSSPTKMTIASVTPLATDPSETASVTVSNFNPNGAPSSLWVPSNAVPVGICPPATITSVNPNLFYAGKSQEVAIAGTGFITLAKASSACPATRVTAIAQDNSVVTVSNVSVISSTSINAYIQPVSTAPTEGATLAVSNAPTPSPNADILGAPIISLNGQVISGPNAVTPNPTPVVGQALVLTTTPDNNMLNALPIPLGINSSTWTVSGGTNIGGYTPTTASASVTPMPPWTTPNLTFYSVYPESSVAETYRLCTGPPGGNGGQGNVCNPTATATFEVTGPTGVEVIPSGEEFFIPANQSEMVWGIIFTASATSPSGNDGAYTWVQLIQSLTETGYLNDGTTSTCTAGPGLDTVYPYDSGLSAEDGPTDPLYSTIENKTVDQINYQMYLMWNPQTGGNSIPVPLGSIKWSASGEVVWNSATSAWTVISGATTSGTFTTSSPSYPQWSPPVITPKTLNCN